MVVGDVEIEANGGETPYVAARLVEGQIEPVVITVGFNSASESALRGRGVNHGERPRNRRVRRVGVSSTRADWAGACAGKIIEISRYNDAARILISKDALHRLWGQHRARDAVDLRQYELFVVDEEERPVAPVEELGNTDRPADVAPELVQSHAIARQIIKGRLVEIVIRIQRVIAVLPEEAAVVIVAAPLCPVPI